VFLTIRAHVFKLILCAM